jgi:hypothetical protein
MVSDDKQYNGEKSETINRRTDNTMRKSQKPSIERQTIQWGKVKNHN